MADTALTLGTAVVEIGADLTKLMAGFDAARRARDQFDADMVAGSGGLLRFTKAANDAGESASVAASKTKTTGDAAKATAADVDKLTEAQARQTAASKAASDALETEAQKTARLSAMIDASIASMNERNRVYVAQPGEFVVGASVPKIPGLFEAQNAAMGFGAAGAAGGLGLSAAEGAAAAEGVKLVENEVESLGTKTKLSSSAIREMLVLVREAGRGDFTRMAGSASLLAQQLGAVEAIGAPLLATIGALAIAVGVLGVAMFEGSKEARLFENSLALTGNRAGLTADSYEEMAHRIAAATSTSVSSNKALIEGLAKTNDFSAAQIERLVTGAREYARATGEDATEVLKNFAKMADGPTKYAEEYQHAHIGVITPAMLDHIRHLEAQGEKEQALAELINITMGSIAKTTTENLGIVERAWNSATTAVSNYWEALKRKVSPDTLGDKLNSVNFVIGLEQANGGVAQTSLLKERDALIAAKKAVDEKAASDSAGAVAQDKQDQALKRTNDTYLKGIDSRSRFNDAVKALNQTLADDVKMGLDADGKNLPAILAAAAKSAIPAVRDLAAGYSEQVQKLKKENLPDVFKADAKAARDAAAALKKLENAAAALAKRQSEALTSTNAELATLRVVLPLYRDQSLSLEDVNRAKTIAIKLAQLKETAESEEGKAQATATAAVYDFNKAIEDETKKRSELLALQSKTESIKLETKLLGLYGEQVDYSRIMLEALNKAKREHITLTDADIAALEREARAQAAAQAAQDKAKFAQDYAGGALKKPTGADARAVDQLLGGKYKAADDIKTIRANLKAQQNAVDEAHKLGLMKEADYLEKKRLLNAKAAIAEKAANDASIALKLDAAIAVSTSLENIAAAAFGKQSAAYKAAFALEKTFTIAKAALALQRAIAEASALPWPLNIPAIISAVAEGAQIATAISQVALNMAGGGMIYGPGSGTSDSVPVNASNGEFMINAQSTIAWRPQLEDINAGRMPSLPGGGAGGGGNRAPNITIQNLAGGVTHDVQPGLSEGDVVIIARRAVATDAPKVIAADLRSPNSRTSKAMQANTNTTRRRR